MKPFRFQWMIPNVLAVSGQPISKEEFLYITQDANIEYAINLREYPVELYFKQYDQWKEEFNLEYFHIGTKDGTGFRLKQFEEIYSIFELVKNEEKRLLIHCAGGAGRTSTAFTSIIMKLNDWSFIKANNTYTTFRSLFGSTEIQEKSLLELEGHLFKSRS